MNTGLAPDLIVINNNTTANAGAADHQFVDRWRYQPCSDQGSGATASPLLAANTFSGSTFLNGGTLTLNNSLALQNSNAQLQPPGWYVGVRLGDHQAGNSLRWSERLNQTVTLTNTNATPAAVALTVGSSATNASTTYSGNMTGLGILIKAGTGTLTMSGPNNNYAGVTTVNAGTLNVLGAINGAAGVAVNGGGTLSGTGTIAGLVTVAGGSTARDPGQHFRQWRCPGRSRSAAA